MKSIRTRTILAFLLTAVLLVPVCLLLFRNEVDSVTKRLAGKGKTELYDISRLLTMTSGEQSSSMDRIQNNYRDYLQFVTCALGSFVSEDGTYTGPRKPFEDGMVVSFEGGKPLLPEEMPEGYPEDAPALTEKLLEEWSLTGVSSVDENGTVKQYPLLVGEIAPGTYYVDIIDEEDFRDFIGEEDFQELVYRTEKIYQAAILDLEITDGRYVLKYESGYFPKETDAGKIGITEDMLKDKTPVAKLGDDWFVCSYRKDGNQIILYAQPLARHQLRVTAVLMITAIMIFFAATLLIAYCQYTRRYVRTVALTQVQAERYSPSRLRRACLARCVISAVVVFVLSMLLRAVWQMHTVTVSSKNDLTIVTSSYKDNIEDKQAEDVKDREEWCLYDGHHMAILFSQYPELASDEKLKEYADLLGLDYIMLFDEKGRQTTSSTDYSKMTLGKGQGERSSDFRRLLLGVPEIVHGISEDPATGLKEKYFGISLPVRKNKKGHEAMILAVAPEKMEPSQGLVFEDQLTMYEENGEDLLVADAESGRILYSGPEYDKEGARIEDFGLGRNSLKDNYMDFVRVNNQMSFVLTNEATPGIYYEISDISAIYEGVLQHGLITLCYMLVFLPVLLLFLTWDYTEKAYLGWRKEAERGSAEASVLGRKRLASYWRTLEPEGKTQLLFRVILSVLIGMVFLLALRDQVRSSTLASYIMYGDWMRGFNLFAFCRIGMTIGLIYISVTVLRLFFTLIGSYTGSKGETICRLILSFIQYIMVFVAAYFTFEYLGFPTSSVISVLALTTLAVSLGSKDLVTDILAGISIIFEDEFRVGDVVELNGFRGTVQQIGLRSTILLGMSNNMKVVNNGEIHDVVNLGRLTSSYYLQVQVPANVPLERYEMILNRELPGIGERNEKIRNGPVYLGVDGLSVYFLTLVIMTDCDEKDFYEVRRYVNREVWLALEKEGISLPPPQRIPYDINRLHSENSVWRIL